MISGKNPQKIVGGAVLVLYRNKRYDACLFFCHLTLEKILKGLVIKETNNDAPKIHDLEKLAKLSQIKLTKEQTNHLRNISGFCIAGRYADIKYDFYKRCTPAYTQKYLKISQQLFLWLKEKYQKK